MKETTHNNLKYTTRAFKIDEPVYKQLKEMRKRAGLSWNLLFKKLIEDSQSKPKK